MQINDYLPECPICYEVLKEDLTTSASCGHIFHSGCLDRWMKTNNICPICRRVIRNRIKLIYEFTSKTLKDGNKNIKADSLHDKEDSHENDLIKENLKLNREKKILLEEKAECENKLNYLNQQLAIYADQFSEVNKNMKEYKNQIISQSYKLGESEKKCEQLKEESELKEKQISELQNTKKELEDTLHTNKGILELLANLEENEKEVFDIKRTVDEFMKKQDGSRCLINFIYLLNQKIKNYQVEIETMKKKNLSSAEKSQNILSRINNKDLLAIIPDNGMNRNTGGITANNSNPYNDIYNNKNFFKKRKFGELYEDKGNMSVNINESGSKIKKDILKANISKTSDLIVEDMYNHATSDAISTSSYSLGNSIGSINTNFVKLQQEQKVNIDSNGIINPMMPHINKMKKTFDANGSSIIRGKNSIEDNSKETPQDEAIKENEKNKYESSVPILTSSSTNPLSVNEKFKNLTTNSIDIPQSNINTNNKANSLMPVISTHYTQNINNSQLTSNNNSNSNSYLNTNKQNVIENYTDSNLNNSSNGNTKFYGKSANISNNNTGFSNVKTNFNSNLSSGMNKSTPPLGKNNFSLKYSFIKK